MYRLTHVSFALSYENLTHVEDKMALNTQIALGEEEPRYVSHPTPHTNGVPAVLGEEELRYVSHPTPYTNGAPAVPGEEEPRYVSHPAAHINGVFWHNTGSDTDNIYLAVSVNTLVRVDGVNVGVPDHGPTVTDMLRSR
jgi:hypothetical protein